MEQRIIELAQHIFKELGPDFSEFVYQKAMELELRNAGYSYENEKRVSVYYRGLTGRINTLCENRIDLYVYGDGDEGDIMLELKSLTRAIRKRDLEQLNRYRAMLKYENLSPVTGLLINFPHNKESIEVLTEHYTHNE